MSYADETDAERVQQIIARAVQDSKWVTEKVYNFNGDHLPQFLIFCSIKQNSNKIQKTEFKLIL